MRERDVVSDGGWNKMRWQSPTLKLSRTCSRDPKPQEAGRRGSGNDLAFKVYIRQVINFYTASMIVVKHKVQQSALADVETSLNPSPRKTPQYCKTSHQLDLISNNGGRPIPLALLRRIDQKLRDALPRNRRRKAHAFGALVPEE